MIYEFWVVRSNQNFGDHDMIVEHTADTRKQADEIARDLMADPHVLSCHVYREKKEA